MKLDEQDIRFLHQRNRWTRTWPMIGVVLFAAVAVTGAVLFHRTPLVVNPFHFQAVVAEQRLPLSAVQTMASLLPFVILLVFLLMEVMVLFGFFAFFSERRLLRIIDSLRIEDPESISEDSTIGEQPTRAS